ncbi:hypothetical protein JXL19_02955 [bacterium]|nr:hypothetical protein [bacterium]
MRRRLFIEGLVLFQVVAFWGLASVAPAGQKEGMIIPDATVIITSDKATLDNKKRDALYSGKVKVVRGELIMTSDSLNVLFYDIGQGVKLVHAKGQVKIWWKDRYAEAEEGIYDDLAGTIVLSGAPKTWQNENVIKGDRIVYDLVKDTVIVDGGVETVLQIGSGFLRNTGQ